MVEAAAAASTVAGVATTTSEGEEAAAAAISGAAAEEDLDEGAAVEALISSKIKDLQNVSSVSRLQSLSSFAVGVGSGSGLCYQQRVCWSGSERQVCRAH